MKTFLVETSVNNPNDNLLSFQEAWRKANAWSVKSGETATIAFAQATSVGVSKQLVVKSGADIVVDGRIDGDLTFETGTSDVIFSGNGGIGYDPQSKQAFGFTMFEIGTGAALRMVDVTLRSHLHAAAAGKDGKSGSNGLKGTDGGEGLPGAPGNGGQSVGTSGTDGKIAVGGILNKGTVVLDRVNFNGVSAFGGNGGAGGKGGDGGDGGEGGEGANGGPGGPGGSGLGLGGNGGMAAAGILNMGNLTLIDTWLQNNSVSGGRGGQGGSGGNGGSGGSGAMGGTGGNGGFAGNGGNGANGAATVMNLGTMTVTGAWADGANTVFAGSGAAGLGGKGGQGGNGGAGVEDEDDGFNGVDRFDGAPGSAGTSAEAIGAPKGFTTTTFYVETVSDSFAEYTGGQGGNAITIAVYRLGSTAGTASVKLALAGLGGASGSGVQGGLFTDRVVNFAANQAVAVVTLFTAFDGAEANTRYRLTISDPSGGSLGGNRTATFTIENGEVIGTSGDDLMRGTAKAEIILAGLGNDTIVASAGNDRYDGQGGIDWLFLDRVTEGAGGAGAAVNLAGLSVSGGGIGNNLVLNIENVRGSRFDDTITGDFNANILLGMNGNDVLDGGFNNDRLEGGNGNDILIGGAGDDILTGGRGRDDLTGGTGSDQFVFDAGPVGRLASHADRIIDFVSGEDTIVLVRTGSGPFDALPLGDLDSRAFRIGTEATNHRHRIIYDDSDGRLYYDPDGNGTAPKELITRLIGAPTLTFEDFLVT